MRQARKSGSDFHINATPMFYARSISPDFQKYGKNAQAGSYFKTYYHFYRMLLLLYEVSCILYRGYYFNIYRMRVSSDHNKQNRNT